MKLIKFIKIFAGLLIFYFLAQSQSCPGGGASGNPSDSGFRIKIASKSYPTEQPELGNPFVCELPEGHTIECGSYSYEVSYEKGLFRDSFSPGSSFDLGTFSGSNYAGQWVTVKVTQTCTVRWPGDIDGSGAGFQIRICKGENTKFVPSGKKVDIDVPLICDCP